jgi:SAM-dependent methyltransferase
MAHGIRCKSSCPACGGGSLQPFYRAMCIPVHSVINIPACEEAKDFPRGDLELAFCSECGFIFNRLFDGANMKYGAQCEETQGFSGTFQSWHHRLAESLARRYDLRNKLVIEIGCGKGEFLTDLCDLAGCRGLGFDPAFVPGRNPAAGGQVQFIQDFYSEQYASYQADLICCKMTLEHIDEPFQFLRALRDSIGERAGVNVFFQVPDARRVLVETAFWDVYYEHCSYFSLGSLARTFRRTGFGVVDLSSDYGGQYIMIHARSELSPERAYLREEDDISDLAEAVAQFEQSAAERIQAWREELACLHREGRRIVLWGSGSKGVSFLSATGAGAAVEYVVDINPYRQGNYMAGHGSLIVPPAFLSDYRPDLVLVMNELYLEEIRKDLAVLGLDPDLKAICGKTAAAA